MGMKKTIHIAAITILLFISSAYCGFAQEKQKQPSEKSYNDIPAVEQTALLVQMSKKLKIVKSLKSSFVQERHLSLFLDTLRSEGILYFEVPDKLRWELTKPYKSILIFNSEHVAKFDMEDGKLRKMKLGMEDLLGEVLKQIISIMHGDFDNIKKIYNITVMKGKKYKLILQPGDAGLSKIIKSLELYIDPASFHVAKIVINEPLGDYIEIRFADDKENIPLNPLIFDLNNPLESAY